jgi:hypothetical protein
MRFFYFSPDEYALQRAMGLYPAFILAGGKPREFTTTSDVPVHSTEHRLVFMTDLY